MQLFFDWCAPRSQDPGDCPQAQTKASEYRGAGGRRPEDLHRVGFLWQVLRTGFAAAGWGEPGRVTGGGVALDV